MYMKYRTFWKKKMNILASSFPKLLNPEEVVTETSKRSCFRTQFDKQRVNGLQTLPI